MPQRNGCGGGSQAAGQQAAGGSGSGPTGPSPHMMRRGQSPAVSVHPTEARQVFNSAVFVHLTPPSHTLTQTFRYQEAGPRPSQTDKPTPQPAWQLFKPRLFLWLLPVYKPHPETRVQPLPHLPHLPPAAVCHSQTPKQSSSNPSPQPSAPRTPHPERLPGLAQPAQRGPAQRRGLPTRHPHPPRHPPTSHHRPGRRSSSLPVPLPVWLASSTAARPQTSEQTQHPSAPPTLHSQQRDQRGLWLRLQDDGWVSSVR